MAQDPWEPWELLRAGKEGEGLFQLQGRYGAEPTTAHAMELGVAQMWLGDYDAAFETFGAYNAEHPQHTSVTYAMAGVALWCVNRADDAVTTWRRRPRLPSRGRE